MVISWITLAVLCDQSLHRLFWAKVGTDYQEQERKIKTSTRVGLVQKVHIPKKDMLYFLLKYVWIHMTAFLHKTSIIYALLKNILGIKN